jgi:hypothetical protein
MLPDWIIALIYVSIPVILAVGSIIISRKYIDGDLLRRHNDITAPIHGAVNVLFAVLLGFVILVVWQQYNDTEEIVDAEANQLSSIERDLRSFPGSFHESVHGALESYVVSVITKEWPNIKKGIPQRQYSTYYQNLWKSVATFQPQTKSEEMWLAQAYERMNKVDELRSKRLLSGNREIPDALWGFLFLCGLTSILLSTFLGSEKRNLHMLMVVMFAIIVGAMLFMINTIDRPFSGLVRIEPEAFNHTLELLRSSP